MIQTLRIGTRGSPLALAQARMVATALRDMHGWGPERIEIVPITTTGDMVRDRPLAELGGKALWTRELDRALAEGLTDVSVHSMKDVETMRPPANNGWSEPPAHLRAWYRHAYGNRAAAPPCPPTSSLPRRTLSIIQAGNNKW